MTFPASATLRHFENDHELRAMWWAIGVLLLTTVHHVYGGIIYNTPWREHAALVAIVTVVVMAGLLRIHRSQLGKRGGEIAFWMFAIVTLIVPVVFVGLVEGGYNHALKNILYFTTTDRALLARLFPPPTYEMPNDAFFETTGVLQFFVGLVAGWELIKMIRAHSESKYAEGAC